MKTLAITGAFGRVGSKILPLLREKYKLVLIDLIKEEYSDKDIVHVGNIRDINFLKKAFYGCDAVLHLAATPDEDDFYTKLMPNNIEGVYTVFDVAHQVGIKKVIFASTCQAVLHYPNSVFITTDKPPRPYNLYACTKLFGESLARYYSDKFGMSFICLRIGWFQDYDSEFLSDTEIKKRWCSPKDLAQLIDRGIQSNLKFGIFFAISDNENKYWDIENAKTLLGYKPVDGSKNE